jgi:O-antigen/teichoic acid export membrane protein
MRFRLVTLLIAATIAPAILALLWFSALEWNRDDPSYGLGTFAVLLIFLLFALWNFARQPFP